MMAVAPAIILHEFGHKFVAMAFGLQATFHAAYFWLGLGVVLKLMGTGFIFFVPAYVAHSYTNSAVASLFVAGAGPFVNLAIWLGATGWKKYGKVKSHKVLSLLHITAKVNMFLFFFNMIPIPPFDGSTFFRALLAIITGIF